MSSRRNSTVPKEDVFPRMLYCDSRCSQTLPGLSPALPGALLCNATRRLGDGKRVILRQRVRGSVRAVRAVQNTRVFQTETRFVADVVTELLSQSSITIGSESFLNVEKLLRSMHMWCHAPDMMTNFGATAAVAARAEAVIQKGSQSPVGARAAVAVAFFTFDDVFIHL
jgi:hypothetical protein